MKIIVTYRDKLINEPISSKFAKVANKFQWLGVDSNDLPIHEDKTGIWDRMEIGLHEANVLKAKVETELKNAWCFLSDCYMRQQRKILCKTTFLTFWCIRST